MDVSISRLDARRTAHVELYRSVRLRALDTDPDAFGSTAERERAFAESDWQERVAGFHGRPGAIFVGRLAGALQLPGTATTALGVVGIGESDNSGESADATLWGMWVAPTARGNGTSTQLLDAAEGWATERRLATVTLWVHRTNAPAIGLYERRGYVPVDAAALGLPTPDGCRDEICLRLTLDDVEYAPST